MPQKDDDKGCSLVIIHSEKGMKMFEEIKKNAHVFEMEVATAVLYNPAIIKSADYPERRSRFVQDVLQSKFIRVIRK